MVIKECKSRAFASVAKARLFRTPFFYWPTKNISFPTSIRRFFGRPRVSNGFKQNLEKYFLFSHRVAANYSLRMTGRGLPSNF